MMQSGGEGKATRKTRVDKKTGVLAKLDHDTHDKLVKLAISCDMTKTKLAEKLIHMCLNSPETVRYLQGVYNKTERYKISPVIVDNKEVRYMFLG